MENNNSNKSSDADELQTAPVVVTKSRASGWIAAIAFLASIAAVAGFALCYGKITLQGNLLTTLQNQIQQNLGVGQNLHGQIVALQTQVNRQLAVVNNLEQLSTTDWAKWRFAEAKYLVQLANYHLAFTHDVVAALSLLQTAEQRIASLNDPTLQPIRQQIANNIAALQAVPKVDLVSILTRITALQTQAAQLPALGVTKPKAAALDEEQPQEPPKEASPLRQAMEESWTTLQRIIIIRRHDQAIEPLLPPEQQLYLQQNLQLVLQQAQWAALREQEGIYKASLLQAQKWVENYFATNLPATAAFLQGIGDLQKINVRPPLPDLAPLARAVQSVSLSEVKK